LTNGQTRSVITVIFLAGLVGGLLVGFLAYAKATISNDDLTNVTLKLLAAYSVHLAVIFGGIFGAPKKKVADPAGTAGIVAIGVSAVWTAVVLVRLLLFALAVLDAGRVDSVGAVTSYIDSVSSASTFLVAGALAYFFASRS
jgi:hypothetical protein